MYVCFIFFTTLLGSSQALEKQKEYSDAIRTERDELRDEVVQLKDILKVNVNGEMQTCPSHNPFIFLAHCLHTLTYLHLRHHNSVLNIKLNIWTDLILKYSVQKHGIVLGPDLCTNGEVEGNVSSGSACTELQHGSSVLGKLSLAKYTSRYLFALVLCQLKLTDVFGIMHILGFWYVDCDF